MAGRAPDSPRRPPWWSIIIAAAAAVALYLGLPKLAGLGDSWGRLSSGDPRWLVAAALFEVGSYGSYVWTFHRAFARPGSRIGWRESYDIALAGVAASRLLATAGAGGIVLSAWALRRSGMRRGDMVAGLTTFYVALYGVFMAALVLVGAGLRTGVLAGPAPTGLTVVPALFGGLVIVTALLAATLPRDLGGRVGRRLPGTGRAARWPRAAAGWMATVGDGVRGAILLLRRRDPALLGALGWWALDIAVLWACFHAFGDTPSGGVIVMAYFTGMLGNLLPLPGGLGGVEGGMIGALLAFGVDGGLALAVVLSYRAFAYWLPIIPGALAYLHLLRTVSAWGSSPEGPAN
ncbi:flippase-like domain-containing protein [Baekduia soli]|uniref:Flippase-like domain-containing protein n=1 Tax=Baekduia soli TaxID=496014 RepID=A0A5B8U1V7_9ACTN|nr:lysylphosphatidylglycerol synthase transmembrane domain-containing protein [Baekduia soli]QEC46922.1 flippase-like domain-containing protein [Baekduia soli]